VRVEVAEALSKINLEQATTALAKGLKDENAKVRRAVINALAKTKTPKTLDLIKPFLKKGDPSYRVEATAASCLGAIAAALSPDLKPDKIIKLLQTTLKDKAGWNEVVDQGRSLD
jgi:aminopeptidase N